LDDGLTGGMGGFGSNVHPPLPLNDESGGIGSEDWVREVQTLKNIFPSSALRVENVSGCFYIICHWNTLKSTRLV
jgi:hypothetical protein